jgi:hypothetical protein
MGRLGYHINLAGPVSGLREKIQAYRESCSPNFRGHVGYLRNVYVRRDTIDYSRIHDAVRCFAQLLTGNSDLDDKTVDFFYEAMGVYKTCPDMIREMKEFEALGVDEVLCSFKWGDLSFEDAMLSMETFAGDVIPALRICRL